MEPTRTTYPFEVSYEQIEADPDPFISAIFSCLESEFLILPKGDGFVEYPAFEQAYETLKRTTGGFNNLTGDVVFAAVKQTPLTLIVLRAMLGFTPPEWAYVATQRSGIEVTQGFARTLDRNIRMSPLSPLRLSTTAAQRLEAPVNTACVLLNSPAPQRMRTRFIVWTKLIHERVELRFVAWQE